MADKNTFGIKLKTSYGNGTARFQKQRANFNLKREVLGDEAGKHGLDEVLNHLVSIEGLDDGAPITVERVKAQDINEDLLSLLMWGYFNYRANLLSKGAAEKNFELTD